MLVGLIGRHNAEAQVTVTDESEEIGSGIYTHANRHKHQSIMIICIKELHFCIASKPGVMKHLETPSAIAQAAVKYALHYRHLMKDARIDEIMLDVGANIGLSCVPVASAGYKVYAFEALPENIELLNRAC